jgi:hypothetical protein
MLSMHYDIQVPYRSPSKTFRPFLLADVGASLTLAYKPVRCELPYKSVWKSCSPGLMSRCAITRNESPRMFGRHRVSVITGTAATFYITSLKLP